MPLRGAPERTELIFWNKKGKGACLTKEKLVLHEPAS